VQEKQKKSEFRGNFQEISARNPLVFGEKSQIAEIARRKKEQTN
jgi:hypothetical protein